VTHWILLGAAAWATWMALAWRAHRKARSRLLQRERPERAEHLPLPAYPPRLPWGSAPPEWEWPQRRNGNGRAADDAVIR